MILLFVLLGIILLIIFMKKFNCDFKGIELIIFWTIFTIVTYVDFGYDGLLFIPLIFFGLYYLIRLIKTQKYIKWYLFIIQIILSIISLLCFIKYENSVCEGWCTGSLLLYIIYIIVFIYMLTINLVVLIINKLKKDYNI